MADRSWIKDGSLAEDKKDGRTGFVSLKRLAGLIWVMPFLMVPGNYGRQSVVKRIIGALLIKKVMRCNLRKECFLKFRMLVQFWVLAFQEIFVSEEI
jgi:hypothetical protein